MTTEEFDSALTELETRVDRLRALYENWFRGYEKSEPSVARKDVERRVYQLRKDLPRNTALRFRYHQLYQRFTTLATYWQRTARQIEEGTYKLQLSRLKRRNEGQPQRRERREAEEEKEQPQGIELDLDESLSVGVLLSELELDEVARALDGPVSGPAPEVSARGGHAPVAAPASPVAQVFGKPGGPGAERVAKPPLAAPLGATAAPAKGMPAPFGGMPSTGKLPTPGAGGRAAPPAPATPATAVKATPASHAQPPPPTFAKPSLPGVLPPSAPRPAVPVAPGPQGATLAGVGKPIPPRLQVPSPPAAARAGEPTAGPTLMPGVPARPAAPPPPVATRPLVPVARPPVAPPPARPAAPPVPPARPGAPIAAANTIVGRPPVASPIAGSSLNEQRMKRIYDEYAAARRRNNEGEIRYEALVGSIQKMLPELTKKHQGKQIDFDVVVKDGRVGLKPKAT